MGMAPDQVDVAYALVTNEGGESSTPGQESGHLESAGRAA